VTRRLAACLLAAAALGAAGCRDTTNSTSTGGDTVTIYSVLPLEGPSAAAARDVADGEKLALRDANGQAQGGKITVNFRSVDSTDDGRLTATSAARAARTVAQDPSAVAAIGAFAASEARIEIPLLNEAGVGLLSMAATAVDLRDPSLFPSGRTTFSRLVGDDASQARALAAVARARGCRRLAVLAGSAPEDRSLAALVVRAAGARARRAGLARAATVPRGACAVLAASQAGPAARAAGVLPAARAVLAPSALAGPAFARALGSGGPAVTVLVADPQTPPAVAAAYARTFGRRAATDALLGYDAMRAVLSAIARAGPHGNDRAAVAAQLQRTAPARWTTATVRGGRVVGARPKAPTFEP